jgi:hypothetical protein
MISQQNDPLQKTKKKKKKKKKNPLKNIKPKTT